MKISVVVCTHNRAHAIVPCLDSIATSLAHAAPIEAEIIVVDNASTDNTCDVVHKWAKSCAFLVQVLFEPRTGKCRACNRAIRASRGDLLVWTDDDCRLDINYISTALHYDAADTEPVLRGGRVELGDPTDLPLTIKLDPALKRWSKQTNSAKHEALGGCILGCNMTLRRSLAERIGSFDERFGPGSAISSGEDTDYIFRAYLTGARIEYVPEMIVFHHHGRKLPSDAVALYRRYMTGRGAVYAKHFFKDPNLCRPAYWDLKHAVRDIISGQNHFMPEMGFSYSKLVAYNVLGAAKYISALVVRTK